MLLLPAEVEDGELVLFVLGELFFELDQVLVGELDDVLSDGLVGLLFFEVLDHFLDDLLLLLDDLFDQEVSVSSSVVVELPPSDELQVLASGVLHVVGVDLLGLLENSVHVGPVVLPKLDVGFVLFTGLLELLVGSFESSLLLLVAELGPSEKSGDLDLVLSSDSFLVAESELVVGLDSERVPPSGRLNSEGVAL